MLQTLISRIKGLPPLRPLMRPPSIPCSVGLYDGTISLVETAGLADGRPYLRAFAGAALPGHRGSSSLTEPNLEAPGQVAAILDRLADAAGVELRCCNLVLPDRVARVNLLPLDGTPDRGAEQEKVLRWRLRKTTPYPIDEAMLDWETYPADPAGGEASILAVAVRRKILQQYEEVFEALDARLGSVSLASFAAMELCAPLAPPEDWALFHVSAEGFILFALSRQRPLFYRCKTYHRPPVDAAAAFLRDLRPSMEYYRSRLGGAGLARIFLWGPLALDEAVYEAVQEATGAEVRRADPSARVMLPDDLGLDEAVRMLLVPCLGPAARGRA